MAKENLGKEVEENEPQGGAEPTGEEPKSADPKPDGADGGKSGPDEGVVDKHGQPGINWERHEKEIAAKDKEIADLKDQIAKALATEEGRKSLEEKIAKLEAAQAEERTAHKLEIAGCVDVKAAKARLDDFDGDVAALKAECPYLFEEKRKPGTTELPPTGAAKGPAKTIREALRG